MPTLDDFLRAATQESHRVLEGETSTYLTFFGRSVSAGVGALILMVCALAMVLLLGVNS